MMDRGILLSILLFGFIAVIGAQELDPIVNFCRRIDHQSVVSNGTLYIDGGSATFINVNSTTGQQYGNITDGINKYLITVDMTSSWDWKTNISVKAITKGNSTNPDISTPMLVRGSLFAGPLNDTKIYSYGGSDTYENVSFPGWVGPTSDQYPLWSYEYSDAAWKSYDLSGSGVIRPSSGATAEARDLGLAFWYNGQLDSGSSTETQPLGDIIQFIKGMVVIDFNTGLARNLSTDAVSDQPRVRGKMVYVPGIGEKGALVLIGGGEKGYLYENSDRYGTPVAMDQIYVFDIASLYDETKPNGTWYQQKATGTVPKARLDHCMVLVSAQDGSSHNIYMYGGRDGSNTYFDDVYVLSLPSFTWINIYTGQSPRYAMTCHLVGNRQMITSGGGTQAAINKDCDWELKGVAIYDLTTLLWGSVYTADAPPYEVPKLVTNVIGGQPTGNATLLKPSAGFNDPGLEHMFFPNTTTSSGNSTTGGGSSSATHSSGASTATSTSSKSNAGAIAGGVVGGVIGLALIGLGIFLFRRRRQQASAVEADGHNPIEKDGSAVKTNNEMLADTQYMGPPAELPGGVGMYEPQELSPANYTREVK